ncbi:MAG: cyclase family protein [Sphaerochaetaceae bacterium]|nr:cyclase family protein [Sphaerochaetaceae bacterium]
MLKKIIDLSFTFYDGFPNYDCLPEMSFKKVLTIGENKSPSNVIKICMPSHGGTHFDAPSHQIPGGETVENVPLEKCIGTAVMLDFSYKYGSKDEIITIEEIKKFDKEIKENDIIVLNTGCYKHPEEFSSFGYLSEEAATWLVKKKIKLLAVDTPSVDLHVPEGEKMPVHQIILGNNIPIVEGLAHLDRLSKSRFEFYCMPIKIKDADGGPVRIVAME